MRSVCNIGRGVHAQGAVHEAPYRGGSCRDSLSIPGPGGASGGRARPRDRGGAALAAAGVKSRGRGGRRCFGGAGEIPPVRAAGRERERREGSHLAAKDSKTGKKGESCLSPFSSARDPPPVFLPTLLA